MLWELAILIGLGVLAAQHYLWRWRWSRALDQVARLKQTLTGAEEHFLDERHHSRAQLQTLFNSMAEGVMLLDSDGRIQLVNQSLERQFGLLVDIRGLTLLEAFHRLDLVAMVQRLKTTPAVPPVEIETAGHPPCYFEATAASVLDREGHPQGTILVFHDLTRLRQLEHTRREFVANVSHELRTPLSLIKGYTETLLTGAKDDPTVATRFLQKIEHHSNRLTNLIADLLTISRLESGQVTLRLDTVALREFSDRLVEEIQARAAQRSMAIGNNIPPDLRARADLDRLHQVFVNLLDNAVKYGKPGGRITVNGHALPDGRVQLCVSDDGPGIPPEAKEHVFERFYRVDKARSRETGGTGLGLAIVKHIVQSHGGEVWVESELGRGASFFFTLPRA